MFSAFPNTLLIGAIQGFVMSLMIFFNHGNNSVRNKALAGFLFALAYDNLDTYCVYYLQKTNFLFDALCFTIPHTIGSFLYLYVSSHWRKDWQQPIWKYFIPFFIILTIKLLIELSGSAWLYKFYFLSFEPLLILNIGYFMFLIFKEYKYAKVEDGFQRWLYILMRTLAVVTTTVFVLLIFVWISVDEGFLNVVYVIGAFLSLLIYWLAFFGYQQSKIIYVNKSNDEQIYWNNLKEDEIEACYKKILKVFQEDKCYLDSSLNLSKLSQMLNFSPKTISAVLNHKIGMGFNEYVNSFRVEEVKRILVNPSKSHLSITGAGSEAGFNSTPTFQRAFKQHTGQTPSEFLQKMNAQITN